ncbi:MAG: FAD-binding protein, partial [Bacteroidetes bacterium]|nr:FAD-binding protein [Bacteroidota bacterium]
MLATSTSERMRDLAETLRPQIAGELRVDAMTNALYATDASLYEMQPLGLLLPKTAEDVQIALEACAQRQIPVLPRGGGSSLSGQTVAEALVIDCSRHLDAILEINAEEQWVRVQPGITLERLDKALAPHGLMVGPDPASGSRATLGGM